MSVPYTDNEASEARQWSNRYGPPNAWTASLGTAARMIGRLLDERERLMADAMLCYRGGGDCPVPDNAANLDAAPAVTAPEPEPEPAARRRPAGGTGDTQSFDAYRRFVGEAMNWISEATGFLHDDVLRTDDARDIITDACSRCWDAFDRIAYPTIHGAAPAARASVGRPRTDNADLPTRAGTGDTPVAESATTAITDAERQAVAVFAEIAWTSLEWSEVQRHANTLRGLLERIG